MQVQINLFALQAAIKGSRIKVRGARSEFYLFHFPVFLSFDNFVNLMKHNWNTFFHFLLLHAHGIERNLVSL